MEKVIEVENLRKTYKEVHAVDGISFQVEKGELFGFLGVNGAGKSTTINMLCTLFPPTSGEATVCGYKLGKENESIRREIGVVYQNNCLDNQLTVMENLMIRSAFYQLSKKELKENLERVIKMLALEDILKRPFGKLSGGQKRRAEIARALIHAPKLLFLDEPTTGLDPATRKNVWESVERLRSEMGMTVFLTTHYMEEAAGASHIAVLDKGQIKQYGTPYELKEQFAKDQLRVITEKADHIKKWLDQRGYSYKEEGKNLYITLNQTLEALPVLEQIKQDISGFEVIQGTMDDVFLNVTGKMLKEV